MAQGNDNYYLQAHWSALAVGCSGGVTNNGLKLLTSTDLVNHVRAWGDMTKLSTGRFDHLSMGYAVKDTTAALIYCLR